MSRSSTTGGVNGHSVIETTEPDVISHPQKGIYSPGDFLKTTEETWDKETDNRRDKEKETIILKVLTHELC